MICRRSFLEGLAALFAGFSAEGACQDKMFQWTDEFIEEEDESSEPSSSTSIISSSSSHFC